MFLLEQIQANEFHNKKYCKKRDFSLFFLFATLFFIHIKNVMWLQFCIIGESEI